MTKLDKWARDIDRIITVLHLGWDILDLEFDGEDQSGQYFAGMMKTDIWHRVEIKVDPDMYAWCRIEGQEDWEAMDDILPEVRGAL